MNADGTGQHELASRKYPNNFWFMPAWSPDGKVIVCAARNFVNGFNVEVVSVGVDDGIQKRVSPQKWAWIDYLAWLSDSSGLVMTGTEQSGAFPQVWHLSYPSGEARKITNDLNSYHGASLMATKYFSHGAVHYVSNTGCARLRFTREELPLLRACTRAGHRRT